MPFLVLVDPVVFGHLASRVASVCFAFFLLPFLLCHVTFPSVFPSFVSVNFFAGGIA